MKSYSIVALSVLLLTSASNPVLSQGTVSMSERVTILRQPYVIDSEAAKDKAQFANLNLNLLTRKNYDELDTKARSLRNSRASYPSGLWKLDCFYSSFTWSSKSKSEYATEQDFVNQIGLVKEWTIARPKSVAARIALAHIYYMYGYFARGEGSSDSVSQSGWKLLYERSAIARQLLKEALNLTEADPRIYSQLMRMSKNDAEFDKQNYNKIFDQARLQFPSYQNVFFEKTICLQPRWHGDFGELEQFAKESADKVGGINGDKFYAQMVWALLRTHGYKNLFQDCKLDYPRVKRGMEKLRSEFPNSISVVSNYCYLASCAQDKVTAMQLFVQLGGRVDRECWRSEQTFEYWRNFVCN